ERPGERGRLADDRVARVDEGAEREREGMAGAVRDEDVLRRHLQALEHPVLVAHELAESVMALRIAIRQGLRPLGLHHPRGGLDHVVVRERGGVRIAAAELVARTGDRTGRGDSPRYE